MFTKVLHFRCRFRKGVFKNTFNKTKRNFNWFILDEFYGHNGVFTYVLALVVYDTAKLLCDEYVAVSTRYFLARELAPNIYIAYEQLSPNHTSNRELADYGCPVDERSTVYVSAKAEEY